jgi:hypothetical protein
MKATCMVMDDKKLDFNRLMADLRVEDGRYSKCQLVVSMFEESARINSSYMKEVDFNDKLFDFEGEAGTFYSSRHHIVAKRIGRFWRAR